MAPELYERVLDSKIDNGTAHVLAAMTVHLAGASSGRMKNAQRLLSQRAYDLARARARRGSPAFK
jgi:hypothetical protein